MDRLRTPCRSGPPGTGTQSKGSPVVSTIGLPVPGDLTVI